MASPGRAVVELSGLSRFYGEESDADIVRALDHVSLTIREGEFVAIMGPSGSGKSTMMNVVGCLDRPTAGSCRIMGRETRNMLPDELAALRRETFGFIFQRYNLIASVNAQANVEIPAIYAGIDKDIRDQRSEDLLGQLGMGDRKRHYPSQLSGGQQQRVAIARALMNDPPVILADEPTGALDSRTGDDVMELLHNLHGEGRTIIIITHNEDVALQAERVIHLHDGKIFKETIQSEAKLRDTGAKIKRDHGMNIATAIGEAVTMAIQSLRVNLFRTALTLLGIVIGVASVVAMLAIGDGARQSILGRITSMGTNLITVRPGMDIPGQRGGQDVTSLTLEDSDAIAKLSNVEAVVPQRSGRYTIRYGNQDYQTQVQGVGPDFPKARDWTVEKGSFFGAQDMRGYASVAVLGKTVLEAVFSEGENPIGKYVLIKNVPFEVIGVMKEQGGSAMGSDQDDVVMIPVTTGNMRLFGQNYISSLTVKVSNLAQINDTEQDIKDLLLERHGLEDFSTRNMASLVEMVTDTTNTLKLFLGAVAIISLLVGGIGVMNIMLVSVTERTREIGIRMATGARRRDILLQFNIESAVVCAIGGIIGVLLGWSVGWLIKGLGGMPIAFTAGPALMAFGSAFLTGIIFGYMPARKAARLDPVVALAWE
ncbi:MAG TPA: macrolide ABC transporter permease/ATP-binding protein MacB [Rhodospirillaceae bacterium]|nr:MAG: macrolide ABC transporter permease/ATP-binding protein MacB [Alphaproteobacteria bacterium GWF2_58_20]HAU29117.1 macrolide ABC transporter permease/ATP-binding protein MacB [Rhodospirillaceae bacterium]